MVMVIGALILLAGVVLGLYTLAGSGIGRRHDDADTRDGGEVIRDWGRGTR